jgi:hypothetical protein
MRDELLIVLASGAADAEGMSGTADDSGSAGTERIGAGVDGDDVMGIVWDAWEGMSSGSSGFEGTSPMGLDCDCTGADGISAGSVWRRHYDQSKSKVGVSLPYLLLRVSSPCHLTVRNLCSVVSENLSSRLTNYFRWHTHLRSSMGQSYPCCTQTKNLT